MCGLIFLRFICPAITTPNSFGLTKENFSPNIKKALLKISMILQKAANGVTFKEEYMRNVNTFLEKYTLKIYDFLSKIPIDDKGKVGFKDKDTTEYTFKKAMKVTKQDLELMWSLYIIHNYLYDKIQSIKDDLQKESPPFSLKLNKLVKIHLILL
jgi:hypothetical protein